MMIKMINGARIRRMITKIVAEAWSPEPSRARQWMRGRSSSSSPNICFQKTNRTLLI